ncbi:MAG: chromosomal replication initiator protein [Petroclostridium sp.]|jgi:chromosomal replication initiator protein|uniref:chromosomal replication initiator protein DnaA n=1 Tax=Petroclostridium xylanilyticum TaxID=1792311 RepID=UPI000B99505E|nr:chromosomal replication initiator protein DnaA [Petroclostridium xylanilyticum]MBZ4646140.1 chromosomal replication initiation protein DnaA [Clostridia bacterium]MDK2811015.1 chromosomal replication initiator protein [Petroclostridium sp.]
MNNYLTDLWNKTLNIIKSEITEVGFNTWIKTIVPISISENKIVLGVPNDFNKNIILGRYFPLIQNALAAATSREFNISVIIIGEKDQEKINDNTANEKAVQDEPNNTTLNPKYTFDTFVVGNSNRFAHAASLAVAESPAKAYNPLFLYGGVGLGKTHLMHAIGHYILSQSPSTKVVYVSSEKFTNELINSIKDDRNEEFRNRYRNIDVLLVDDIQFIAGKERTQEEFFHTFNALHEANKQIILTSDRPPKEIHTLEERLRSRFEWGLIGDIQPPDLETRIAILKKKAQLEKLIVPDEILIYVANKIKSNIRELEGALNRIIAFGALVEQEITQELADEALKDFLSANNVKTITPAIIQEAVGKYFNIKMEDFKSSKRTKNVAYPRQIAMYLCRELTDLSLPKIGEVFGGRDHTTVLHAIGKIEEDMKNDSEVKKIIEELNKNIKGK